MIISNRLRTIISEMQIRKNGQVTDLDNEEDVENDYTKEEDNTEEDSNDKYTSIDDEDNTSNSENEEDEKNGDTENEDDDYTDYTSIDDDNTEETESDTDETEYNNDDNTDETEDDIENVSEDDIKKVEEELFSNISDEQKKIRNKELLNNYNILYNTIDNTIIRVNKIERDNRYIKTIDFILSKLTELKDLVKFYISETYKTKSYIENSINYNQNLQVLSYINKLLQEISNIDNKNSKLEK